ncbi:MAG TPA: hypothetical protein VND65_21980 [Candidatus Binatia bacterium]|nr:hypothetical protein [Candidatus Binatia bacterium]
MSLSKSEKLALDALIAKGDLVGAQNLLGGKTGAQPVEAAAAAEPAAPPPPRSLEAILLSLFEVVYSLFGSNPALQPLLEELRTNVTPPTTESQA